MTIAELCNAVATFGFATDVTAMLWYLVTGSLTEEEERFAWPAGVIPVLIFGLTTAAYQQPYFLHRTRRFLPLVVAIRPSPLLLLILLPTEDGQAELTWVAG